jgi:hypothetical protein
MEIIAVYCENHEESINTLCWQNAKLLNDKAGDTYSYHCALNINLHKTERPCCSVSAGDGPNILWYSMPIIFALTVTHPPCYQRRMQNNVLVVSGSIIVHWYLKVKTSPRVVIQSCNWELCQIAFWTKDEGWITVIRIYCHRTPHTKNNKGEKAFFAILDLMFIYCT